MPYTAIEDSHISKATNRLTSATNYDEAGNVVSDDKFRDVSLAYDANGRMVSSSSNMAMVDPSSAVYDAAGNRVATFLESMVWTFFVYDAFGRMVTEYGGMTAVDEGGVKYLLSDRQGSSRAVVSKIGR
ncbi:MAG: hypothetical protein KBD94_08955 [Pyrinomonadaceae bacterium]|nr:hypothetical protein [Pyrinomonadaceae bacterium]